MLEALAAAAVLALLASVLFGSSRASGPAPATGALCPGGVKTPSGLCWTVTTAPDLTDLAPDALKALVKNRLTEPVGTPVAVFALSVKYPSSVMFLSGRITKTIDHNGVASSYEIVLDKADGKGPKPADADLPTLPQTVDISPLGIARDPGVGPGPDSSAPPLDFPTPDLGTFPGGTIATALALDDVTEPATPPITPSVHDVALLHYKNVVVGPPKELPVLVLAMRHAGGGDLGPLQYVGYVAAPVASAVLGGGMAFAALGAYVTFPADRVGAVRPATVADVPHPLVVPPVAHATGIGGDFGAKSPAISY